jgi:hypothetical protein
MSDRLFDGDYTTISAVGPYVSWFDESVRTKMFKQRYEQFAGNYVPLAIGTTGPNGSFLVEETPPTECGIEVVTWERIYAQQPPTRWLTQAVSHSYQFLSSTPTLVEIPLITTAKIENLWYHVTDPTTIPILHPYVLVQSGTTIFINGTAPGAVDYIVHTDSEVEHWKGNFYVRRTAYVPNFGFTPL